MSFPSDKENNNIGSNSTLSLSSTLDISKKVNAYLKKSLSGKQGDKKYPSIFEEEDSNSEEGELTYKERINREQALLKELSHLKMLSNTVSIKQNNKNNDDNDGSGGEDNNSDDKNSYNDNVNSEENDSNIKENNNIIIQEKKEEKNDNPKLSDNDSLNFPLKKPIIKHPENNHTKFNYNTNDIGKNRNPIKSSSNYRSSFSNNKSNTIDKEDKFNKTLSTSRNKNYKSINEKKTKQEDDFKKRENELKLAILEVKKKITHISPPKKQIINTGLNDNNIKPAINPNISFKDLMLLNEQNKQENIQSAKVEEERIKKKKLIEYRPPVFEEDTAKNNIKINKNKPLFKDSKYNSTRRHYNNILQDNSDISANTRYQFKTKHKHISKKYNAKNFIPLDIVISGPMTIREISILVSQPINDITSVLKKLDINLITSNQYLHPDIIELVILELGHKIIENNDKKLESELSKIDKENLKERPPIIAIMGHVDHGKTTLLDVFRKSNIVDKESGGITQHIGAYQVDLKDSDGELKKVTFIDTPGHEAFFSIRSRGSKFTDIVILVVAADDGVKAQTIEIINHIKHSGVAVIVAVNKIDTQGADINKIAGELLTHDIVVEDMGGDIMMVPISAKNKTNISQLGEVILLQSQMMELKADHDTKAKGMVIEASIDKKIGIIATLLVMHGSLKVGDTVVSGNNYGKIKRMTNAEGATIKNANPSYPIEVIGFSNLPSAGESFIVVKNEKEAKSLIAERENREEINNFDSEKKPVDINSFFDSKDSLFTEEADNKLSLNILLKTDNNGSLEAMTYAIEAIPQNDIQLNIVSKGLSVISESDALFAKDCNAIIIAFGVKTDKVAQNIIEKNKIITYSDSIIYKLVEYIEKEALSKLDPTKKEDIIGQLEVRALYNKTKGSIIFGGIVLSGKITHNNLIRVLAKNTKEIKSDNGKVKALKRFKDDVKEVANGYECGMAIEDVTDIEIGDIIECYDITEELKSNLS